MTRNTHHDISKTASIDNNPQPLSKRPVSHSNSTIAHMIDHTILKPEATFADVTKLCQEALDYGFYAVCVNGAFASFCRTLLPSQDVKIATVVGFPLGAMATETKVSETGLAVLSGVDEIDMVMNVGLLKSRDLKKFRKDISAVVAAASSKPVKVILETVLLTADEKKEACLIAKEAGAAFVKTSTGFGASGATMEDVRLMRLAVGSKMGVKASGGIRDLKTATAMIEAGATRLGTSASIAIVTAR